MPKQDWKASGGQGGGPDKARWAVEPRERWRSFTRLSLPVIVLLVALGTLLAVLQWLSPPVSPTLFVLSTQNVSTFLPPNDPALGDAASLRSLKDLFEVSSTQTPVLTPQQLSLALNEIKRSDPQPPLLTPWKPTELIVYVSMVGVRRDATQSGAGQSRAWLVAEGFDPDRKFDGQLVSVRQLLESVAGSTATRKLVILDCQRLAVNPHFGLATEQFVEAVQEDLSELSENARAIPVLLSCSSREVAWPMRDPERACTAFGHFFVKGVAGAADATQAGGNNDRRVTLDELTQYLAKEVGGWTSLHCNAPQTPFLTDDSTANEFTLSVLSGRSNPTTTVTPARTPLADELKSTYQTAYSFARRTAPPDDWTPAQWAMIYHDLTAAERLYRAGNVDETWRVLRRVDGLLDSVASTHRFLRGRIDELSPSSRQFLAHCCADGWPEVSATDRSPADEIVTQVVDGTLSPADADKLFDELVRESPDVLPVPAHWTRLLTARSRVGVDLDPSLLRDVIALRQTAELAARPGHPLARGWMRPSLDAADAARRDAEDRLLLQGWSPLAIGIPSNATGSAREKYDAALNVKNKITRAYRLRDRLLAELPYWIAYVGRSASHDSADESQNPNLPPEHPDARPYEGKDFPATANLGVEVLLDELEGLYLSLLVNPDDLADDEMSRQVAQIDKASVAIEVQLTHMEQELAKYAGSLADARVASDGGATWRRIDDLLVLPFAMVTKTADHAADAQSASQLRAELLARALAEYKPDESAQPVSLSPKMAEESQEAAAMYARLYSLPLSNPQTAESSTVELAPSTAEVVSGRLYNRLVARAAEGSQSNLDRTRVQSADVAFRLLQYGREADLTVASPAIRMRISALKDWLTWQSQRMCADFYAATSQSRPPYFARVSTELLDDARRLADVDSFLSLGAAAQVESTQTQDTGTAATDKALPLWQVRQEVQRLLTVLDSAQLRAEPAELTYRGDASEKLAVDLLNAMQFPSGTAAVQVGTASAAGVDGATVHFLVSRPEAGSDHTVVSGYFRGHEFTRAVPQAVIGKFAGPAIAYRRQNSGNGRIRFRANRVEQEPIHLLFVLDCSGSMGLADSSGERRIEGMRRALTRFVETVDGSNVHIGVRLFGHRVEDINSPEARSDTELAAPIGRLGVGTLDSVRDLLIAKGHSPMFRAMIDAKGDFGSVGQGRRVIVLISDGADNWALAGEKPGFNELLAAYQGARIQINTIGFHGENNADFAELRRIATAGDVEGRCLAVENANDVLHEMAGLVGLPGYRIVRDGEVVRQESQFSSPGQAIELSPGQYDVEILGAAGDVLTQRAIRLLPADEHVFVYDSGTLRYATAPAQSARAMTVGGANQPDLLVFDAQSMGDEFVVEFGLEQKLGNAEDLAPVSVRIAAMADASREREWVFKHLTPNVADQHFPRWRVSLADWPADATHVEVEVVWNDLAADRVPIALDWDQEFEVKAATNSVSLVRRDREQVDVNGSSQTAVLLTFALTDSNANIEDWAVSTPLPIVNVRQSYSRQYGMYTVQLVVSPNSELNEVTLFRTTPAPTGRTLRAQAQVSEKRINP